MTSVKEVYDSLPAYYLLENGNTVSKAYIENALKTNELLLNINAPEVVYNEDFGWNLQAATPDPLVWMGNGTWLSRSTIQNMIDETGYLNVKGEDPAATEFKPCYPSPGEGYFGTQPKPTTFKDIPYAGEAPAEDAVSTTLKVRGENYGDFSDNAFYAQNIKDAMHSATGWYQQPAYAREALDLIASKIGRMLSGNPLYVDNWHDIGGYAKLVEDRITEGEK